MTSKHRDFRRIPLREHEQRHAADVLDLASSANPYGPPASLLEAVNGASWVGYPDATSSAARQAVATRFRTTPERVVIGNGVFELLWTAVRVLLRSGDAVLTVEPTCPEFAAAARNAGARLVQWRAVERTGHRVDLEQVGELMALERPSLVSLCAPATPSGASVPFDDVKRLALRFPDTYFVVDQSLLALGDDCEDLELLPPDNVLCLRSLGKELGLSGLRVGYCLADVTIAQRMEACRPAFSVNSGAQAAVIAGMQEDVFIAHSRQLVLGDRNRLAFVLSKLGLVFTPSVAPFLLLRMDRAAEVASELLTAHGIAVRECSSYGLPDHLRIAGLEEAVERRFETAMRAVIERRKLRHGREV